MSLHPTVNGFAVNGNQRVVASASALDAAAFWATPIEGGMTAEEMLRVILASVAGKASGAGTTNMIFTGVDGATPRITATVDAIGNRTSITLNGA